VASVCGTVQHGLMRVTDWLPTLVTSVAGFKITELGRARLDQPQHCTFGQSGTSGRCSPWAVTARGGAAEVSGGVGTVLFSTAPFVIGDLKGRRWETVAMGKRKPLYDINQSVVAMDL
jgi:hypothetical protein